MPDHSLQTSEFETLCLLIRPQADFLCAAVLLSQGASMGGVIRLADEHGARARLVQALEKLPTVLVPSADRAILDSFRRDHTPRMLSFAAELGRIAAAFAEQGIPFLTFKGPALSLALYGDLAAREYGDLDILVPEAFMARAEDVLASFGYRSPYGDRPFRLAFQSHLRQFPLERPNGEGWLDLHWEFVGSFVPFPLRAEDVWGRLGEVTIGGQRIPTLVGVDLALLLAGHGTKEAWRYLAWVLDFAMLIDRQPEIDWTDVHRRARAQGCGDTVLLGCALSRSLFEVAVPDMLAREVASNVRVAKLASRIVARLRQGTPPSARVENFADFDLCDRAMDRLVARLRLTLTPTVSDHQALPLPRSLWGVYYLTRPFRLAAKAIAEKFR